MLKQHLANMREAARHALGGQDIPPALARRLEQVVDSTQETITSALSILEQGQTKAEPLSPGATLYTVATLVQRSADQKGIQIVVEPGRDIPSIVADRAMMISCLANTTRNSIEALPPGSLIELRADLLDDPERVRISIRDDGTGTPDRFRDLAQPFTPTEKGGLGLGVILVRDSEGKPTGGAAQYFEAPAHEPDQEERCYWSTPSGLDE
jgi:two-component system C4-dicarboxylate transport sensor histidine kinase DctB